MDELITVGIPFFNPGKHLFECLNSVIKQTHSNIEILLIDDGSTDDSLVIIEELIKKDSRIKLVSDGKNRGLIARLNQIIQMAKGKYIARMDADDIMLPQRLETQLNYFRANPDVDIVSTAAYTIDQNNKPIGFRGDHVQSKLTLGKLLKKNPIIHPSILVRSLWYQNNLYDSRYFRAEDLELWCRTVQNVKIHMLAEPLILYREGNVNVKNYNSTMRTLRKIYKVYGKNVFTPLGLYKYISHTYLKSLVYSLFGLANMQYLLTLDRSSKLSNSEKIKLSAIISALKLNDHAN